MMQILTLEVNNKGINIKISCHEKTFDLRNCEKKSLQGR